MNNQKESSRQEYKRLRKRIRKLAGYIEKDIKRAERIEVKEIEYTEEEVKRLRDSHNALYLVYLSMPRFYTETLFKGQIN